jgi:hypothetical protein
MTIAWETNVTYLKLGKNSVPIKKDDTAAAVISVTFSGTTVNSKPKYPNRAIRAKREEGGDFYSTAQTFTWLEGESDTKYAEIEIFKQDDDRILSINGKIKLKSGESELNDEGFANTLFIAPEQVKDLDNYVAEEFKDADVNIFTQSRNQTDVVLCILDGENPFNAGITTEKQNSSLSELGSAAHISVDARYLVEKLPRDPEIKLKLPVTNGDTPVVLSSFVKQQWTLTEPDNINSEPKDVSQPADKIASNNLILPANSNVVRIPLELSDKWLQPDKALMFHYPLDSIESDGQNQIIQEKIANRVGILVEAEISDDVERITSVEEVDGRQAINFNSQFHFLVDNPNFITPEVQEFTISIWYHVKPSKSSYNHFCEGLYTNNTNFMFVDLIGTSKRNYVMLGGYGRNMDSHYYHENEMDADGSGWFLYTWTRNTKTGLNKYYVNGVLVEVLRDRLFPISQPGRQPKELIIGKRGGGFFHGNALDFKGYNKELTQDEIMSIYRLDSDTTFNIGGSVEVNLSGVAVKTPA